MCPAKRLSVKDLHWNCDPADIPFETSAEILSAEGIIGQDRAVQALEFGIGIRRPGYNLFAAGPAGVGKQTLLNQFLGERAAREPVPSEWCYVHNFQHPEQPRAIELPPGVGTRLKKDMERMVEELRVALRAAFESEEYRTRNQQLATRFKERQEQAMEGIRQRAKQQNLAIIQTPTGMVLAPLRNGAPIPGDQFHALPKSEKEKYSAAMERIGAELQELLQQFHDWGREHRKEVHELNREMAATTAHRLLQPLRDRYAEFPAVLEHLDQVELDVVDSAGEFLESSAEGLEAGLRRALQHGPSNGPSFRRYQVNVLVERGNEQGAPVVYEDHPTYANLIGRIEHESQFGALSTNFTLIKAGALHRALGGYLVLDALKVLQNPFSWEALKRTIRSGEIKIEAPGEALGLISTVTLSPEPVDFGTTKVVLTGDHTLYYMLSALDPDYLELFKVIVDFEESMDRKLESQQVYARLIASLVSKEKLRPFDRSAVARVIEQAGRAAGDAEKLSVGMRGIVDLLRETDYWAGEAGHDIATGDDVQRAIDAQLFRSGRIRQRMQEAIQRNDILVDTTGESIGQINGLSVLQWGEHAFGRPTRITARVRLGRGEIVDIEREVELGGPIHSKGVLILTGFLGSRYALRFPLSLSATLVFEQSYGMVEGDSASLAELCALLSALAEVPLRQSLAMTGSVNQQGEAQSVGGLNEKIEGFFDICQLRGLTGDQGVIIPRSNVKNLMLRRELVEAVEAERFHVYAIESVDEAMELLTGRPAGTRDSDGKFPPDSINGLVEARLATFARSVHEFLAQQERGTGPAT